MLRIPSSGPLGSMALKPTDDKRGGAAPLIAQSAVEMARLVDNICPRCRRTMIRGGNSPYRPTRDHILPVSRGGDIFIHGSVPNYRLMCGDCNGLLAMCGHCPGAEAAVRDVSRDLYVSQYVSKSPASIAASWRLPEIAKTDGGQQPVREKTEKRWHRQQNRHTSFSQPVLAPPPPLTLADIWPKAKDPND